MSWTHRRMIAGSVALAVLTWLLSLRRALDYDEGVYAQTLSAVGRGHRLVSDVFTSQPPLWPYVGLPGWLVGGVTGTRIEILLWALVALAAFYRVATRLAGEAAGAVATALVAVSPAYVGVAAAIEAELPAIALALVALDLALQPHRRWTPAAVGVLFGAAVMIKLLVAPMAAPIVVALFVGRRGLQPLVALVAAVAVELVVGGVFWDHGRLWSQMVGFHLASQTFPAGTRSNLVTMTSFALGAFLLMLAAGVAGLDVLLRHRSGNGVLLSWYAASAAFLVLHSPVFAHHLVLAILPSALLITVEAQLLLGGRQRELALSALVAASAIASVIGVVSAPVMSASSAGGAVAALRRLPAEAVLVTDDQRLATEAGRQVPGPLVDTSQVRISAQDLTGADVCDQIEHADAVLLTRSGRFVQLPAVASCTDRDMRRVWADAEATLYVRPGVQLSPAAQAQP